MGETETHKSCGEKARGDWRSGEKHAILDILSITQLTGSVNTKSEASCAADDITIQEKNNFGKDVG